MNSQEQISLHKTTLKFLENPLKFTPVQHTSEGLQYAATKSSLLIFFSELLDRICNKKEMPPLQWMSKKANKSTHFEESTRLVSGSYHPATLTCFLRAHAHALKVARVVKVTFSLIPLESPQSELFHFLNYELTFSIPGELHCSDPATY